MDNNILKINPDKTETLLVSAKTFISKTLKSSVDVKPSTNVHNLRINVIFDTTHFHLNPLFVHS